MVRGASADEMAHAFGVSAATMKRRMRELRGKVPAAKASVIAAVKSVSPTSSPTLDDEPPPVAIEGTLKQIDEWLAVAKERAEGAAATGNADEHATYMRMVISLLEARRKATPPPKVDPNDSPDMVAAAAKVRKHWHDLANALVRVSNSPIADTIGRILSEKRMKT
jgi:hypothetical protein